SMVVSGALFLMGLDPWTASLIGIGASALIGAVMGFFVTVIGLNHFITSLAAMVIVRGLCLVITKGTPLSLFTLPPGFKAIGQGSFGNVPYVIVIFVVVVAIFDFLLRRATAFRKVFY
ncbi:MAG: ABC transporter permease, partial [Mesorhizobium sp.]